jgi:hypothetical protein
MYTLIEYTDIREQLIDFNLDESTINNIKKLTADLGIDITQKPKLQVKKEKTYKWTKQEPFKATTIIKKEGIEELLDEFRGILNKLSSTNYDNLKESILDCIDNILKLEEYEETIKYDKIMERFNDVIKNNRYFTDLYVKLFMLMTERYIYIENYHSSFLELYYESLDNIEYNDPDEDYDKYCVSNKTNEQRKTILTFIIKCIPVEIYSFNELIQIMTELRNRIDLKKMEKEFIHINEEITENISVLMTEGKDLIMKEVCKYELIEQMKSYSQLKTNDCGGFSSRMRFKYMDIIELYK